MAEIDELLTPDEVAAILRVPKESVLRLAKRAADGDPSGLPFVKLGRWKRFEPAEVEAFKQRHRTVVVDPMAPSKASASRKRRT